MTWLYDYTHVEVQNAAGVWVDITIYVRPTRTDVGSTRGRDTELDRTGVPGRLAMGIDNASGIFTPGNVTADLQITLGMPIRVIDVIGYKSFRWFTGTLEMPDTVEDLEGVDNIIVVTAVDRKQLLDNGRAFVSTLTEYIKYTHRSTLIGHWPCNDSGDQCNSLITTQLPLTQETAYTTATGFPALPLVQYANKAGPSGDDTSYPTFTVGGDGVTGLTHGRLADRTLSGVTLSSTYLAVSLWVYVGSVATYTNQTLVMRDNAFVQDIILSYTVSGGAWIAAVENATGTGTVSAGAVKAGAWQFITVRLNLGGSGLELWVDSDATTGSFTGSFSGQFDSVVLDCYTSDSSTAQLQIHQFSTSSSYDRTAHLAQAAQGRDGLVYQTPGERIATVLQYASPTTAIPSALDAGSTYMARAQLAGKTPGQALDEAVATEVGRLFVDGDGITKFHSRVRAYNL